MILVTGATGTIGRGVVDLLLAQGEKVRALTRDPARSELPAEVDVVRGEPSDYESLVTALDGIESAFLVVHGDAEALARALRHSQTGKVVLVSSMTAATRPELAYAQHLRANEQLVRSALPTTTILHPGQFASNALWWQPMIAAGVVRAPFGDVAIPVIDPIDIAAVAATTLLGDGHAGATYALSGPELLSPRQKLEQIAQALRRTLDFTEQSEAEFRAASATMSVDSQDYFVALTSRPTPEELVLTTTVEDLTGRPAHTFADWARRNRDALAGGTA